MNNISRSDYPWLDDRPLPEEKKIKPYKKTRKRRAHSFAAAEFDDATGFSLSEVQVNYSPSPIKVKIQSSLDSIAVLRHVWDRGTISFQEHFCVLFIDAGGHVLTWRKFGTGTKTGVCVDISLICAVAALTLAQGIIIAHNHPSGNLKPSRADEILNYRLRSALSPFDIKLMDSLILGPDFSYYSFIDNGNL